MTSTSSRGRSSAPSRYLPLAPAARVAHRMPNRALCRRGIRVPVQALLRGRAEGRLELIKGDEKQVRVVGAGAGAGEMPEA